MLAPQTHAELQSRRHSTDNEDQLNSMEAGGKARPRLASLSFLPVEITEDDVHSIETRLRSLSDRFSASLVSITDELGRDSEKPPE